jgi:carboxymethylenebutenolidase
MWTDVVGLRPVFREMGRRLAALGYVVLVPNPFYRWTRAPVVEGATNLNDPEVRTKILGLAKLFTPDLIDRDSRSFFAFLDARPEVDKTKKAGVHGYCMGGQFAFRSAASVPDRIGAVGSFHGANLVTEHPLSPHRLIGKSGASYLVAIARNDDVAQPDAKNVLRTNFAAAAITATVEVFGADHGWCVEGTSAYDQPQAEKAWSELCQFYERALV